MNDKVFVRRSAAADTDSVHRLLRLIADIHREGRPDMFPNLTSKYTPDEVRSRLSSDDSGVFVAELNGEVVGYIFCDVIKEGNGTTLYIDDLCVDPSARKMGVGTKLIDRAASYGKEKKCSFLMLNVWEFNKNAVDFYEKYGFKTRTRHLEMSI